VAGRYMHQQSGKFKP